jgi:predicted nucleic acid-binding protein
MLATIPNGTRCFIDANVFVYHFVSVPDVSDICTDFLKRVEQKEIVGITSSAVVAEAVHKVMLADAMALHSLPHKGLAHYLQKHSQLLNPLSKHKDVIKTIRFLGLQVEPLTLDLLELGASISAKEELLTNDSLTIAVMQNLKLEDLVTNDDNFDKVSGIKVWKPRT